MHLTLSFRRLLFLLVSLGVLLSYQNCNLAPIHEGEFESSSVLGSNTEVIVDENLEQKALEIINSQCLSCHSGNNAAFGINLEGGSFELLSKNYIVAGLSEASYLYNSMAGAVGIAAMPPSGAVSDSDLKSVKDWIDGMRLKNNSEDSNPPEDIFYNSDVAPIISNHCLSCHSSGSGVLRLDSYNEVMKVVQPGVVEQSLLYDSIVSGRMPKGDRPMVSDEDLKKIQDWIKLGARQ